MRSISFAVDFKKIYDLAQKANEQEILESDLYIFKKFLDSNYELKLFLENVSIQKESRLGLIKEAFSARSKIFWEIISLLVENEEIKLVSRISEEYTRYLAAAENIEFAELILSKDPPSGIVEKFKAKFGKNLSFKVTVDHSILGGFIVRKIDGTVIDSSLSGRLEELKRGIKK